MPEQKLFVPDPDGPLPPRPLPPLPPPLPWPQVPGRFERYPWLPPKKIKLRYPPAEIKILIVVDGGIMFDDQGFGLSRVLTALEDHTHDDFPSYARFAVTKATRAAQEGRTDADDYSFTFTPAALAGFHEVWMFGIDAESNFLGPGELDAVTNFMNAGGGVLAMGDHEDLGLGLCGKVPRVRSMRKWHFDPLPPGELKAPDSSDLTRIDTVQALSAGGDPNLGQQFDATPQPVFPAYNLRFSLGRFVRFPHPVLCGPRGAILVFPDHQHEGDCVVPAILTNPIGSGATPAGPEYPGGVAPTIIARGRTVAGRTKAGFTLPSSEPFGLLGAYDGHTPGADVGRILVDSTWHHWFNVNLDGFADSSDATVATHWNDIQAFFRNCAVWLAPKAQQVRMRKTGQLISLGIYPAIEFVPSVLTRPTLESLYRFGIYAADALGRLAPQCQSSAWLFESIREALPIPMRQLLTDEVRGIRAADLPLVAHGLDRVVMSTYGATMAAVAKASSRQDQAKLFDDFDDLAAAAGKQVLGDVSKDLDASMEVMKKLFTAKLK